MDNLQLCLCLYCVDKNIKSLLNMVELVRDYFYQSILISEEVDPDLLKNVVVFWSR
jgi:hypothetical protein